MNISAQGAYRSSVKSDPHSRLTQLLNQWVRIPDGSEFRKKNIAKFKILKFCKSSSFLKRELDLKNLDLCSIPPLPNFLNMKILNLSGNKIRKIDSAFSQSVSVREIYLSNNQLECIDSEDFSKNKFLERLILSGNKINQVHFSSFFNLPVFNYLDLTDNNLREIPIDVFEIDASLRNGSLRDGGERGGQFSDSVKNYLIEIKLKGNPLKIDCMVDLYKRQHTQDIIGPIFYLPLETNEDGMMYSTVNKGEGCVCNDLYVEYLLNLKKWLMEEDGSEIFWKVEAHRRILEFIDQPLNGKSFLYLCDLELHTMPPLNGLLHLTGVTLAENYISKIDPKCLPSSSKFRDLVLNSNRIKSLDVDSFPEGSSITRLGLEANELEAIEPFYFERLTELELLDLNHNRISCIHPDSFLCLKKLDELYLGYNDILSIDSRTFRNLVQLSNLYLHFNSLINFQWPSENLAEPKINLENNPLSLSVLADLNEIQNMPDYRGPRYEFSVFFDQSLYLPDLSLGDLPFILKLWGCNEYQNLWDSMISEGHSKHVKLYVNMALFLSRLYNEIPRTQDGDLPISICQYVMELVGTLEKHYLQFDLLLTCCNMASDALSNCVDRMGVTLILMTIYAKKFDADSEKNVEISDFFSNQIDQIRRVVQFVEDVDTHKIVYNIDGDRFLKLESIYQGLIEIPNVDELVSVEDFSQEMRDEAIVDLKKDGYHLKAFNIGDQVEDVLLILNTLKRSGLCDINAIDMRFGQFSTLDNYMEAVIQYLRS